MEEEVRSDVTRFSTKSRLETYFALAQACGHANPLLRVGGNEPNFLLGCFANYARNIGFMRNAPDSALLRVGNI